MALTRATDKIIANADGNLNLSGIVTASSFVGNVTGAVTPSGDVNVGSNIKLGAASGIITATSFSGDGSNLTSLPAGLGTALSSTQTSPLNKLYYTNEILSIGATVTVDHPATGTGAYTQYADLRLEDGADLIISDGDDVIPDILGLGTDGGGLGAGGTGRIRVDSITNKNANGAPNFPNGLTGTAGTFTGAISAASGTITGNLGVGGVLTYEDVTNVDSVGVITARSGINVSSGRLLLGAGAIANPKSSGAGSIDLDNQAFSIIVGGNHPSGGRSNNNAKTFRMSMVHYALAEEPINILQGYCDNSDNNVYIGGGTGSANSLTSVRIYTGANTTTTGGTERFRIHSAGQIGLSGANYGSSGQVLTSQGSSSPVQWATPSSFPSHIDIWRVTSDMGLTSGNYITSNWSRAPQSSAGDQLTALKGAQVTESSGVFTFPTTGIWQIMFQIEIYKNGACRWFEAGIMGTEDNFSSLRVMATGYASLFSSGANTHASARASTFYKVSNVSNNKIKFRTNMAAGVTNESSLSANQTWVEFVRVSDI